ncbi:MAG: hypothetical protein QXG40_07925 [Ignisphaera sp.]
MALAIVAALVTLVALVAIAAGGGSFYVVPYPLLTPYLFSGIII